MKNIIIMIIRFISTSILGILVGMIAMMGMHYLSMVFYPLPEGVSLEDANALNEYMKTAPFGALIMVIVSHSAGAFIAGVVGKFLANISLWKQQNSFKLQALFIGLLFTYFGWLNLQELTHPSWFKIDLFFYVPAAFIGTKLVSK
ncbi:MAG: hypothetical protein H8E84_02545 [Flavobacteriales bacterium]|nr:hypothetical protein [Flavobacteriales bacterium]